MDYKLIEEILDLNGLTVKEALEVLCTKGYLELDILPVDYNASY